MFVYFNKMIERQFDSKIKCPQTDWCWGGGGGGLWRIHKTSANIT